MHVISLKRLREFWGRFPDAETPLRAWYKVTRASTWENFAGVRDLFPHADLVERFTVFNMGGNKYRLVAVIHFNRHKVYVRHVLTHKDYDKGTWKED